MNKLKDVTDGKLKDFKDEAKVNKEKLEEAMKDPKFVSMKKEMDEKI